MLIYLKKTDFKKLYNACSQNNNMESKELQKYLRNIWTKLKRVK